MYWNKSSGSNILGPISDLTSDSWSQASHCKDRQSDKWHGNWVQNRQSDSHPGQDGDGHCAIVSCCSKPNAI